MRDNKRNKGFRNPSDILTVAVCRLICLFFLIVFLLPLGYVLLSSVRSHGIWGLDGYRLLLKNELVLTGLKNSVLLALLGTAYSLALEIPAAYVLSKKQFGWLTNLFFALGQFGVALLPLYLLLKELSLLNTLWGLILPSGLSVYYTQLLRARMINLPHELEDAAALDGCGPLRCLIRISLPLIGPSIGVLAFFHICGYWGNTLLARTILTDESKFPLTLVLDLVLIRNQGSSVLGSAQTAESLAAIKMAEFGLCVISALPPILAFLSIKKHIRALETDSGVVM